VPHVLVPRQAWPDDRFPHWAVAALRAAGARVSEAGRRADVALLPALRPAAAPRIRAGRVIGLIDVPARPGDERLSGVDLVATSQALAWEGARVVRPAVEHANDAGRSPVRQGVRPREILRIASVGPLHWSAGHEHAVVAAARLGAAVELRIVGAGPAREEILFAAFDLGIERSVTVGDQRVAARDDGADGRDGPDGLAAERAGVSWADVVVVPAVEDRAWPGLLLALAAGVPVVASDLPTARELAAPVLAPPRDPAALGEAIGRAAAEPPRRKLTDLAEAIGRHGAEPPRRELTDLEACGTALLA
jgi:glycosyltransferase involved in cell wall biosynthesis